MKNNIYKIIELLKIWILDMPFSKLENRNAEQSGRPQKIPKNIYQTFKVNSFGKRHLKQIEIFRKLNPTLNFIFFDESSRDKWMANNFSDRLILQIYNLSTLGPSKADIFRYCILYKQGGYYFDISKGVSIPIEDLHSAHCEAVISYEKNNLYLPPKINNINNILYLDKYILQWGLAFTANHIILKKVIESIEEEYFIYKNRLFSEPKIGVLMYTGTGRFTKIVRDFLSNNANPQITQAGIDFNGHGIFEMPGSKSRYILSPAYTEIKNNIIVK